MLFCTLCGQFSIDLWGSLMIQCILYTVNLTKLGSITKALIFQGNLEGKICERKIKNKWLGASYCQNNYFFSRRVNIVWKTEDYGSNMKVMTFWWTFCSTFCQIIIESFTLSDSLTPNVFLLLSFQLNLFCSHQILCSIFVSKFKLWNWISLILLLSP